MRTDEVFGIRPNVIEHSYIDRKSLDDYFGKLVKRQQTHIAIRGASKVGKSWLRQKVLQNPIVVNCRLHYSTADIYRDALARLEIRLELESKVTHAIKGKVVAEGEAGFKLIAKASGGVEVAGEYGRETREEAAGKDFNDLEFVAALIRESGRMLVVEDFHYLSIEQQKQFAFDLKTLWDYRTFVTVIGVWISENMLITLNPDLADRIEEISVTWQPEELKQILHKGSRLLNVRFTDRISNQLAEISYESAGLLQKLALRMLDDELNIVERSADSPEVIVDSEDAVHGAAMHVSEQLNQLYQAFAKRVCEGIRTRRNSTGIYAHAMAAVMAASDADLTAGLPATAIFVVANAKQPRIHYGNLKVALARFPELQVDEDGRGLVIAYNPQGEKVSVVDKQLLLYRRFATVKWPWEDLIDEVSKSETAYEV